MVNSHKPRPRQALAEVVAAFALIALFIWVLTLRQPPGWIALVLLAALSHVERREGPIELGFGWREFRRALTPVLLCTGVVCGAGLIVAGLAGSYRGVPSRSVGLGLIYYFWWGLLQQYMLNAFFLRRLTEVFAPHRWLAAVCATALFVAVHAPNGFLMLVAAPLGLLSTWLYLRYRSVWALGLAHGAVGTAMYLTVPDWLSGHMMAGPRFHS